MSASDFGVAFAALIFLRWADFEEAEREAIAAFDDAEYEPVLPTRYHWRSWCNAYPNVLKDTVGELPTVLGNLLNRRDNAFATQLGRVANGLDPLQILDGVILYELVSWLAKQPFETPKDRLKLRDLLDEVLRQSLDREYAPHTSPHLLTKLMAALAGPQQGESVYDPCFGSAGLLTSALDAASRGQKVASSGAKYLPGTAPLRLAGIEVDPRSYLIGLTRLVLSGVVDPQLELGDSLQRHGASNPASEGFDIVLANPPWGGKVDLHGLAHYPVQTNDSSALFLQHALSQLRPGGRTVIAVPASVLFRKGREEELRRMLVQDNTLEAIIAVPRGSFSVSISIDSYLLVIRRGGTTRSIRMVNAASDFAKIRRTNIPEQAFVDQILRLVRSDDQTNDAWDVDAKSLADTNFDLTPKRRDRSGLKEILDSLPRDIEISTLSNCCEIRGGRNIRSSELISTSGSQYLSIDEAAAFLAVHPEVLTEFREDGELRAFRDRASWKFAQSDLAKLAEQRGVDQRLDALVPYVRIGDVKKGVVDSGSSKVNPLHAADLDPKWKLRAGDLLVSKSGTIGKAGIVRNGAVGAIASSGFFVIQTDHAQLDPHFLLAYLQSAEVNAWLDDHARGSAARHLAMQVIRDLPVPLPPLQIQQRVAEECRRFNVDALTYFAELVSEDQSDALPTELNEWVASNARIVEDIPQFGKIEALLESLESIARNTCPVNLCQSCGQPYHLDYSDQTHIEGPVNYAAGIETTCLACWLDVGPGGETMEELKKQSPLIPWAIAFRWIMESLERVSLIPDMSAVYGLLQTTKAGLAAAVDKIEGNLPNEQRARELTEEVSLVIGSYLSNLTNDTKLSVDVVGASVVKNEAMRVSLRITNGSRLPLHDLDFEIKPPLTAKKGSRFPFLSPGSSIEIDYAGNNQWYSDDPKTALQWSDPKVSLSWSGRTIAGYLFRETQELAIDFDAAEQQSEQKPGESESRLVGSPYICGDPVKPERSEMFFGREDLLQKIERSVVESGNVILLEGNRRAGKSSVLWHLEGEKIPGWLGVYCSLQGAEGDSKGGIPTEEVFRTIAYAIVQSVRKLNGSATLPDGSVIEATKKLGVSRAIRKGISEDTPFQDFREYLELVLEQLAEQNLGILLMLDEFDKLQEGIDLEVTSPHVPENIRYLVQSLPRFSAILTGSRRLKRMREEYWSALFGLGTRFGVTSLSKLHAERLIVDPVKKMFAFAKPAVDRCYELTAGQPYLLQCLCNRIFDSAVTGSLKSITVDHVERAAQALVKDNEHFASLWDYTEFDRRRFLLCLLWQERHSDVPMKLGVIEAKLEEAGVELPEELLIADLEELIELELVDRNGESSSTHYSLSIPMMGQWIDSQQDSDMLRSRARGEAEDIEGILESHRHTQETIKTLENILGDGSEDD
ncbi:N-6 DNA methylase [Roseiconus lacunae]|uniref:N-6 DNA methylase n=1 Tax=Roseiconus lacunae TaxID=2605694 RepID=UPI001E4A771F|nr:N-6 DNA methylase [Roseiconus lacunae]MCD0458674.1 N-6 DNA methylase [Roseiconus lacunae]